MRTGLLLVICLTAAHADDLGAQSIAGPTWTTDHYQLVVFEAGHFAIQVGGSWMPGCICLNVNGTPQYQASALSQLTCRVNPVPDGREIVITGRLTDAVAFTETITCAPDHVGLTYRVRALRDLPKADITITAGPQLEHVQGVKFTVAGGAGSQDLVFPPAQPVDVAGATSITWHDLGRREARTTIEAAGSRIRVSQESALYTALLTAGTPLKAGQEAEARMHFEATPQPGAEQQVRTLGGRLGHTLFRVSGAEGLLNHLRTDRGGLIEALSLNEQDTHQVQVGGRKGWGGLLLRRQDEGKAYDAECGGDIVNAWRERVEAKADGSADEVHLTATRTLVKGPQRLRVLMYVTQRLEQERTPFRIVRPDGTVKADDRGEALWFGMPPAENEAGLGPYRQLGEFPAGSQLVVPMPARGEVLSVRFGQPMKLSAYRFDIYFRGVWFEALDPSVTDLDFRVRVERLPEERAGALSVWRYEPTSEVALSAGGSPLLESASAFAENGAPGPLTWQGGELAAAPAGREGGLRLRLPVSLQGTELTVGTQHAVIGADLPAAPLPAGARLRFRPTATETVELTPTGATQWKLSRNAAGVSWLEFRSPNGGVRARVDYQRGADGVDPLAARPLPPQAEEQPATPFEGLRVLRDQPARGDVTVATPWWEVVHRQAAGGAITSLRYLNGTGRNVLRAPIATVLRTDADYRDTADATAKLEVGEATPERVVLTVTGRLKSAAGDSIGTFTHRYEYRPMLVRRSCRYELDGEVACRSLAVGTMHLAPWLDEGVARRAGDRTAWFHAVFPGPSAFEEPGFSQYLGLFKRGVEGVDWVPAGPLAPWQGFGGQAGKARYAISGEPDGGPVMVIEPLALGGDAVALKGALEFDSYLSLPQVKRRLVRRNFVACLSPAQCTDAVLAAAHEYGVTDIMLGCALTPGKFLPDDVRADQDVVRRAKALGIKVYPFDPFQLVHRSTELWQQHHQEFARRELKGGKAEEVVYSSYGDYFCPESAGFRDALKAGYTKLVESAGFGGLYHDFVHPYTCVSPQHAAAPHLNTDGVLDVILWDRRFLGPERVFCGHTGWVPVLFYQDLCTVTAIFEDYPANEPLPLHLAPPQGEFVNAAQRTLVSSFLTYAAGTQSEATTLPPAEDQVDAYLARCALTGIFPWAHAENVVAKDVYELPTKLRPWLRLFALRGGNDLASMQFLPWHRQTAALVDNPYVRAATYWNADRAVVVLANSETSAEQSFGLRLRPEAFGWPRGAQLTLTPMKDSPALTAGPAYQGKLAGLGWAAYEVRR